MRLFLSVLLFNSYIIKNRTFVFGVLIKINFIQFYTSFFFNDNSKVIIIRDKTAFLILISVDLLIPAIRLEKECNSVTALLPVLKNTYPVNASQTVWRKKLSLT